MRNEVTEYCIINILVNYYSALLHIHYYIIVLLSFNVLIHYQYSIVTP
jgi:hypothetical protein